jgi:cell division protein FtsN
MSGNGAYEGEMNSVALFENALRAAVPTRPDPKLGATLVPRLAEIARAATLEAETHPLRTRTAAPRSRLALVARVGIAVALIPLVLAGLAFAGVHVPSPARSAFESVGITLPNQPSSDSSDAEGTKSENPSGKAKGNDVSNSDKPEAGSKGRSEAAHKHAREQHNKAKGKALGHEKGKAIGLNGSTPPGQAKPKEPGPPPQSNAGGNSAAHTTTLPTPQHTTPTTPGSGKGHGN